MSSHIAGFEGQATPISPALMDRRSEPRESTFAELWMVDPQDATVLRCRCLDRSTNGMRLRVPLGYGVHKGHRYQLCSHPPGTHRAPGLGLAVTRWATVGWTKIVLAGEEDHLDVGVQLDADEAVLTGPFSFPGA